MATRSRALALVALVVMMLSVVTESGITDAPAPSPEADKGVKEKAEETAKAWTEWARTKFSEKFSTEKEPSTTEKISDGVQAAADGIKQPLTPEQMAEAEKKLKEYANSGKIDEAANKLKEYSNSGSGKFDELANKFKEFASRSKDGIKGAGSDAATAATHSTQKVGDSITHGSQKMGESLSWENAEKVFGDAKQAVGDAYENAKTKAGEMGEDAKKEL